MLIRVIKSRKLRWAGHVMEEGMNTFKILRDKISLKTPRCRWEVNIRTDLKETGINTRNWVDSTQDSDYWIALVNAALNLPDP